MKSVQVTTPNKSYEIFFDNSYDQLASKISLMNKNYSKILIITDDQVGPLYVDQVKIALKALAIDILSVSFPNGEVNKNYKTINTFYEYLIQNHFDRSTLILALGGGVTGDMAGFTAATYMRGVDFIQLPTSLLAQVDSSSGGKTGIDFNGYKNIVGAFYQPELVYINTETLKTLPSEEFASGMGEALKHGFIQDKDYTSFMEDNIEAIRGLKHDALASLIGRSCEIKAGVVSEDEKEHGLRAILNFGHTIGHAIEKLKNFEQLHGECVGLGMIASSYIGTQTGDLTEDEYKRVVSLVTSYGLPEYVEGLSVEQVYQELFYDKKTKHSTINIVMLKGIGSCYQNKSLSKEFILEGLKTILK